jgi:quercetin dioxygenase-like cupin family protein
VLAGDYLLTVSGRTYEVGAGGFALVPRGAPHRFTIVGEHTARAVVVFAPAGFEEVFRQMPDIFGSPGEPVHCGQR